MKDRLSKEQWLDHGLKSLARDGFTVLKADKLAKSLGVSRGSFYWHFKNLADFHQAVLARWRDLTVNAVIEGLEQQPLAAPQKIKQLVIIAGQGDSALENALRAWGTNSSQVKKTIEAIDQQRLGYLQSLFETIGVDKATAFARARIIYYAYLGQIMLGEQLAESQRNAVIDELVSVVIQKEDEK
ncbi:MAG: TetR/AcrR family transcriptional regulator [Chloroflexota bacterium]